MQSPANNPLEIITLNPDDIVVVWVEDLKGDEQLQAGAKVTHALRERGHDNLVIVLHKDAQLASIDPETMAHHGWTRKANVNG